VIFSVKIVCMLCYILFVDWVLTFNLWCCVYFGFRFLISVSCCWSCCKLTFCINYYLSMLCSLLFYALFGFSYLALLWCVSAYWWSYYALGVAACTCRNEAVLLVWRCCNVVWGLGYVSSRETWTTYGSPHICTLC
jgi:hypothetical protein